LGSKAVRTAEDWLQDPSLFATCALALLIDRWGLDFVNWDPITVELELKADFGIDLDPGLQDRIQAASTVLTSDLFFVSPEAFAVTCDALNFGAPSSELLIPADLDDVLWGVSEVYLLLGSDRDREFSHGIARYVGALLSEAGIKKPPSVLEFAEYSEDETATETKTLESDDILFKAFWERQAEERQGLEAENNVKLMLLFRQLAGLPLKTGNADSIRERLNRHSVITP